MCDTVCGLGPRGAVFAKNSDRPPAEAQLVHGVGGRPAGGRLATQYLDIPDAGSAATLLSQPTWLWGAEHGVNEHRVAIGNETVWTTLDAAAQPDGLIGMDLVRLGLERGTTATEALEAMTDLLSTWGQGGLADAIDQQAYFSSFLLCDPTSAWILETSGRSWAAKPVEDRAALSNRLTLRDDWRRASPDVAPGTDLDTWRDPAVPTGLADGRLAASRRFLDGQGADLAPAAVAAHLRDHGQGPWGAPGSPGRVDPPPTELLDDWTGMSVCMHLAGAMATTSSMVVELPVDGPWRGWVAPGSPCVSVYLPVLGPSGDRPAVVPEAVGDDGLWHRLAELRDRVQAEPGRLDEVRQVLDPLEGDAWAEAEALGDDGAAWAPAAAGWCGRLAQSLGRLGV